MQMSSDSDAPRPFIIEFKRVGCIRSVNEVKNFGFIEAEDYRDDVFFHMSQWESAGPRDRGPRLGQVVEFVIDELYRRETGKLRAKVVRATKRPIGTKLTGKMNPGLQIKHHPKARQKKPAWRRKDTPES